MKRRPPQRPRRRWEEDDDCDGAQSNNEPSAVVPGAVAVSACPGGGADDPVVVDNAANAVFVGVVVGGKFKFKLEVFHAAGGQFLSEVADAVAEGHVAAGQVLLPNEPAAL